MAKKNSGFVAFMDDLPLILKVIFALPGLDFIWGIYRLVKGIKKGSLLLIVVGIIWTFGGIVFLWLVDLITILMSGRPTVLVD